MSYKLFAKNVESEAYDQIKYMTNHENYKGFPIAIMPDVHAGKGCTIGTTIRMHKDDLVVTPNLVGVDIGCLDKDTEVLTPNGWCKISEYKNESILVYDKNTTKSFFERPIKYIKKECDEFFHFKNSKGLDQMLCEEHKILTFKGHKSRGYNTEDLKPNELLNKKLNKGYYTFETTFNTINDGIELTENEIRCIVMVQADGTLRKNNRIELHFSKERKIERAEQILKNLNLEYSVYKNKDNTTSICFVSEKLYTKNFNKLYTMSKGQLGIVCEECLYWDGHLGYRSYYSSTNKENADFIQFAFASNGIRAGISIIESDKYNDVYVVTPTKNTKVSYDYNCTKVKSIDGFKYCFTTSTGYFVARRNGKIFVTGNCGMLCAKLDVKKADFDLVKLDKVIKDNVPSGFNVNTRVNYRHQYKAELEKIKATFPMEHALASIGTLGGGNHFIEANEGKYGEIYLVIHSGSRNLGKLVCDEYAKKVPNMKDPCSILSNADALDYINDMKITQKYAEVNREEMLRVICLKMGIRVISSFQTLHNYIDFNGPFDSVILRKGAVSAKLDETLLIPMNMRDGSLLCIGKGNSNWNYSAPHGAGRLMSRSKAKEKLDMDEFKETMKDVYTTSVVRSTLDEAPMAYKPMEEIVEQVKDTVDIIDIIKPIYNYKAH